MYRSIAAAGATAAAVLGAGAAALATSGPATTDGTASASTPVSTAAASQPAARHRQLRRAALRHAVHGELVTHGKHGFVTHSAIRGTVTNASPTALTVKAADGFTQTFTLTTHTRIREHSPGKRGATNATASVLHDGDQVAAFGKAPEKSGAHPTASVVIDGVRK